MNEIKNLTFTDESIILVGNSLTDSKLKLAEVTLHFGSHEEDGDEINYEVPSLGYCVVTDINKIVKRIYFEVIGNGDYINFPFKFKSLDRDSSRELVRNVLGKPQKSGEEVNGKLRKYGAWDAFSESSKIIHFEYTFDTMAISKVVVGVPSEFPF